MLTAEGFGVLQFFVDSINPDGLLLGRNENRDIPLGTLFTTVRLSRGHRGSYGVEDLGAVASVALTLCEVQWYQRSIEFIPGGHTAALRVAGVGLDVLAVLLRDLPQFSYLSIAATDPPITQSPEK